MKIFQMRQSWKKRATLMARLLSGYLSADFRSLPNCLIIGAQKAGTSTLFEHLTKHPEVSGSFIKEIQFFDRRYEWGTRAYHAFFPMQAASVVLEASPNYMFFPAAAERAHRLLPKAKIIALLREPVSRAISSYYHSRRHGWEDRPIHEAMTDDIKWYNSVGAARGPSEDRASYYHHSYFRRGIYSEQLGRWSKYFSAEQILVLKAEDLFGAPQSTVAKVQHFLGISEINLGVPEVANRNNYPCADIATMELLRSEYRSECETMRDAYQIVWDESMKEH
jgi:hypothetical protein